MQPVHETIAAFSKQHVHMVCCSIKNYSVLARFFNIRHWKIEPMQYVISLFCVQRTIFKGTVKKCRSAVMVKKVKSAPVIYFICYNDPPALVYTCLKSLFASHKYRERGLPVFLMRGRTPLYCIRADLGRLAIRGGSWASHQDMASKYKTWFTRIPLP